MPWTPADADQHTHRACTARLKKMWSDIANSALSRTGDDARAIREANAVVAREADKTGECKGEAKGASE